MSTRTTSLRAHLGALCAGVALAAAAASPAGAAGISFTSPDGRQPVFGPIDIALEVDSAEPLRELALFVDGSLVARLQRPPWRVRYDLGQLNVEHQLIAEATTLFGTRLRATRTTPAVAADEQVEVELVQLFVRVKRALGASRPLAAQDFHVHDELGAPVPVTTLARGGVPISIVVLVDSSISMKGDPFRDAVVGAQSTAALLDERDEVMIALFSDRLLRATPFTHDREALEGALAGVEPSGGSSVFDFLYFALNRLKPRLGRPVVILFSDGEDVSSTLGADDIRWRARRSQATIYWVRVQDKAAPPRRYTTFWKDEAECTRERATLESAVDESGGGIVTIASVAELSQALIRIFFDLRSQYVIGVQPPNRRHDGSWRPITVGLDDPQAAASARGGYVDE